MEAPVVDGKNYSHLVDFVLRSIPSLREPMGALMPKWFADTVVEHSNANTRCKYLEIIAQTKG